MAEVHRDDSSSAMAAVIAVIVIALIIGLGIYAYRASGVNPSATPDTTTTGGAYNDTTVGGTAGGTADSTPSLSSPSTGTSSLQVPQGIETGSSLSEGLPM